MTETSTSAAAVNPYLARLAQAALQTGQERVADITEAVRRARRDGLLAGGRQADVVGRVRALVAAQRERRAEKDRRNLEAKFRRPGVTPNRQALARPGVDPLAAPLADRAARRSLALAQRVYDACPVGYRRCRQGHATRVRVGAPQVHSEVVAGESYSSRCSYRRHESVHTLTIPALWCVRVHARGLAACDGLFTLDARRVPGAGTELFEAVWIEQGRGTNLDRVHGYIARIGATTYHAATARAALDGVRRKAGQKPARRRPVCDLNRLARRHGGAVVTLADSEAVGNCPSGTRSWCLAVGIDPDQPTTLAHVIRGYQARPLAEALAVIRRVWRQVRQRKTLPVDEMLIGLQVAVATGSTAAGVLRDYRIERGLVAME